MSAKRIEEVLIEYAIQMDNQCMFLPQEKVGSFTELRSTDVSAALLLCCVCAVGVDSGVTGMASQLQLQ